ncbi:hypothetical protein GCM10028805_13790 [Spirosoma harenae]
MNRVMRCPKLVLAASLLISLLGACNQSTQSGEAIPTGSYLKVNFNGQTKTYTEVNITQAGNTLGEIKGSLPDADNLSVAFFGSTAGTYPYKQKMSEYSGVSQIEYSLGGRVYNNYKARVCPATSGYYSTQGVVKLTEYIPGKLAKGTFTGELLDANDPDQCSTNSVPFSGEFSITK